MTEHPITLPPELITHWCKQRACISEPGPIHVWLATQAARWGADQELEACLEWHRNRGYSKFISLREDRRPKPPSLKEQALLAIDTAVADGRLSPDVSNVVRRALEQLDD